MMFEMEMEIGMAGKPERQALYQDAELERGI